MANITHPCQATTEFLAVLWIRGFPVKRQHPENLTTKYRHTKKSILWKGKMDWCYCHSLYYHHHYYYYCYCINSQLNCRGDKNFTCPTRLPACLPACLVVNKWICRMKVTSPQSKIEKVYNHCCKMKWNPELPQKLDSSQNADQNPSLAKRSTTVSSLTVGKK